LSLDLTIIDTEQYIAFLDHVAVAHASLDDLALDARSNFDDSDRLD
jgi:hypothetical protein